MRLWLLRGAEVPVREQLVTQLMVAILSGDLTPGQKLPSTRQLARCFRLHPNTISAGYRQLEQDRWVEFRRGSGVYVRNRRPNALPSAADPVEQLIISLFQTARDLGVPLAAARERIRQWMDLSPPDHFLLVEPDDELRAIVMFELQQALSTPVRSCGFRNGQILASLGSSIPVVLPSKAESVRRALPAASELITLQIPSIPSSLAAWVPAPPDALVGVASRWANFLTMARTVLIAAGFSPDMLLFRDARKPDWRRGLRESAAVVCDVLTAKQIREKCRKITFPLLTQSSIDELKRYERFLTSTDRLV